MKWDGEWHITYEVFRDLGIAFARGADPDLHPGRRLVPVVRHAAGHHGGDSVLAGRHPAGARPAGRVLHRHLDDRLHRRRRHRGAQLDHPGDFIELRLQEGMPLDEAVIDAGAVRFRPMMLTAAAVVVGAAVILFDPIFQGLAIALMAGEIASLALSRMTVPIVYFIVNRRRKARMTIERYLRLIAGFFVMLSVALGYWVNPDWFLFTAFVGLNLFQSAFTNWCPMITILQKLGAKRRV